MFRELNPLLHSRLRLAVMSLLVSVEEADFTWLREKTGATAGNLSVQLDKLSGAGYIRVKKEFVGRKTRTSCSITTDGRRAFEEYVEALKGYIGTGYRLAGAATKKKGERFGSPFFVCGVWIR